MEAIRRNLAKVLAPMEQAGPLRGLLARPSARRIVLVAIVRDELEYLLEWVAWHRSQGFRRIVVGDHESVDGSTELLEALEACGVLERRAVFSVAGESTQKSFYNRVVRSFPQGADPILGFLDADEFILGDGRGPLAQRVARVFRDDSVSALGLNWRIYGSSGYARRNAGPVLRRFAAHAGRDFERNRWIKSFVRRSRLRGTDVHHAGLRSGRYVDAEGRDLVPEADGLYRTADVRWNGLYVGHFILKSRQEFEEKKRFRGSAAKGRTVEKGPAYFAAHDRNGCHSPLGRRALRALAKEQSFLLERLEAATLYYRYCEGGARIDEPTRTLEGWLAYAGQRLEHVEIVLRAAGREWRCPTHEDGTAPAPHGTGTLHKRTFTLPLEALADVVDPSTLELRPHGSCTQLPLKYLGSAIFGVRVKTNASASIWSQQLLGSEQQLGSE